MSERLPYEMSLQQHWTDLPLPDANLAWADMKRRLEEDDDRPLIAWWRRGCVLWGVLLLVLLAIGWWWFNPGIETQMTTTGSGKISVTDNPGTKSSGAATPASSSFSSRGGQRGQRPTPLKNSGQPHSPYDANNGPSVPLLSNNAGPEAEVPGIKKDSIISTAISNDTTLTDSAIVKKDSVKKEEKLPEKPQTAKTDSSKKKRIFFSAGIAEHQQIPLAGQKFTPYSASGRKGSLADYIPSVYFRINKENKWFIQFEFRYGAPQYTKEFQYKNNSKLDTVANQIFTTTTNAILKKTYYHQLPVTFNYYVLPGWSLGAGIAWNKFSSAVSDQDITRRGGGVNDTTISSGIVKIKKDSVFSKSYFQAVFETQYKVKRFSFGARYMFGLEPYIKFTLPGAVRREEKNSSLQVFLRYELWKSKNK